MIRYTMLLAVFAVALIGASPELVTAEGSDADQSNSSDSSAIVSAINSFGWDVYKHLATTESNLFISPFSIATALTMTWAGARGDTALEMSTILRLPIREESVHIGTHELISSLQTLPDITVANGLFPGRDFNIEEPYEKLVTDRYLAAIMPLDYARDTERSRYLINQWVEKQTGGKLRQLIASGNLDPATVMVLANTIHFKGVWLSRFDEARTIEGQFKNIKNEIRTVPMMHQKRTFRYLETDGFKLLEMPYADDRLVMTFLLPSITDRIGELETRMWSGDLQSWIEMASPQTVAVSIPKFTIEWGAEDISSALKAMGMNLPFSPKADFSGMARQKGIYISRVLHKSLLSIDEEGTEAAAASAVVMRKISVPKQMTFALDHPFLLLIRDRASDCVLFIGKINDLP